MNENSAFTTVTHLLANSKPSLPASLVLLRRGLPWEGLQKRRLTTLTPGTHLALTSGHAALQVLLLHLKWKDWIAYALLILLPPVAGPEIAHNPHSCQALRSSFSWSGSAQCVRAEGQVLSWTEHMWVLADGSWGHPSHTESQDQLEICGQRNFFIRRIPLNWTETSPCRVWIKEFAGKSLSVPG